MRTRSGRRWAAVVMAVAATALLPGAVVAGGPGPSGVGAPGNGQPDDDTQLSVLTPAQEAFMQLKLDMAAAIAPVGQPGAKASKSRTATVACEFDPCDDPGPWPADGPPPDSKTLLTKARQQNNNYFCGPASGQVVINWSRGIIDGNNDGEDATTNWRKQSKIAEWMRTTTAGTGGANLAAGLNHPNAVLKPIPEWVYSYANTGSPKEFHNKVVTDIATFGMPLVLATAPHIHNAGVNFLESWPKEYPGAHHWIVIRGYDGLWGSPSPTIKYQDSSARYGGGTGAYADLSSVLWQVNEWNQGGNIVW
jgi:hypothetical protein